MFVCVCFGVTDKQIEKAVTEKGVGNIRDLRTEMSVGGQCGKCIQMAQDIIDKKILEESIFKEVC